MWQLARSGRTVVWDRRDVMPVMFSSQGVVKGPLEAFESQLEDPETWCALFHMLCLESARKPAVMSWAKHLRRLQLCSPET